jgi:minor extracellular serine protease Vpr
MVRRLSVAVCASALLAGALLPGASLAAGPLSDRQASAALEELKLSEPVTMNTDRPLAKVDRSLAAAKGRVDVVVRLASQALGSLAAKGAAAQREGARKITGEQTAITAKVRRLDSGARVLGTVRSALNAVVVRVKADQLAKLADDPRVVSIRPVRDHQLDLSETVPYIGATAVQNLGFDGTGVRLAILDTGVDYTHVAFGGPGTVLAYKNAYGVKTKDAKNTKINDAYKGVKLFPTAKVIGGYDFVGEAWTGGLGSPPLAPDPDPIDCSPAVIGCGGGHGTHVADIAAGQTPGAPGVAPGAQLYAVKVCSSITTSCSGLAMIQGMDWALDPNGDDNTADHADVLNMSIGSPYGQANDDDTSAAVETLVAAGMIVVGSAGNSGDKPYVTGTPAATAGDISVAQTATPSAVTFAMQILAPASIAGPYEAVLQPWSHPLDFVAANEPVQYGNGTGGNLLGCDPFAAGSLAGKIVLVDRGVCNFSLKIANIAAAGGKIGIIGLVTTDDPFEGALGLCPDNLCSAIPGFMVHQLTATRIKNNLATVRVTFDPANGIPLVGHMVGSSSRGPDNFGNSIKPEIGAPGASVSAVVGTGNGTEPFGGTSGAAPMVTGSAALLHQAYPSRSVLEIKAVLMNAAETDIMNRPAEFGGDKAPITRIGGGEVRVDRALHSPAAAWVSGTESAALSFGFHDITASTTSMVKTIRVRNYSDAAITYGISSTFRFANDAANGAISLSAPPTVLVPAHGIATFDVTLTIDGTLLLNWTLNSGSAGANGARLTTLEYDGYVWLDDQSTAADDAHRLHLPWQVLPRRSGDVEAASDEVTLVGGIGTVDLTNNSSVGTARIDSYSLVATSPDDPGTGTGDAIADVDLRAFATATFAVPAATCASQIAFVYMVNTWERQIHADAPALFEVDLDTDRDGDIDYAVFNQDLAGANALSDGRNLVFVLNVATGVASAFFFTDHGMNASNTGLTFCGEQVGLALADVGKSIDATVFAVDFYQSGTVRDEIDDLTLVVGGERFFGTVNDIAPLGIETLTVSDVGAAGANPSESGVLLVLDAARSGFRGGSPAGNDALLINVTNP